jgi:hypothetical protein
VPAQPVPPGHPEWRDRFDRFDLSNLPERWWPKIPHLPAVVASILAVVAGVTATEQLNAAFAAMHVPGNTGGTFTGISGPGSLWSASTATQTVRGWYAWQATQIGVAHNIRVLPAAWITVGIHLVGIALPVALMVWFAGRASARRFPVPVDKTAAAASDLGALARFGSRVRWPVAIVLAALLRDVLLVVAVSIGHDPAADVTTVPILLRVSGAFAVAFYAAIGLPVFALAYAHLAGDFGLRDIPEVVAPSAHALRRVGQVLVALRLQIIAAAILPVLLLTLGGGLGEQIDDLALRWSSEWWTLIAAVAAAIALYFMIRVTGAASWRWYETPPVVRPALGRSWWLASIGVLLLVGYGVSFVGPAPWSVLLWPGLCFLGVGLIARVERPDSRPRLPDVPTATDLVPAMRTVDILAVVPMASLGIVGINAGVQLLVFQGAFLSAGTAYVAGALLALVVAGWLVADPQPAPPSWMPSAAVIATVLFAATALGCIVDPVGVGQRLGALAVLLAFSGVLMVLLFVFVWLLRKRAPIGPIALLRIRRIPVMTFLMVWLLVTALVQGTDHYHDARLLPSAYGDPKPITAATAVSQWLAANSKPSAPAVAGQRTPVPMLFVASLGGGIRAAYWTNLVLDCLFDKSAEPAGTTSSCAGPQLDEAQVFAESGVSGGAVGIAMHRALGAQQFSPSLGEDFVSPDIAAMVFRDAPEFWIPTPLQRAGHDRADVLEQAWEQATGGAMAEGLFASAYQADGTLRFPLAVLNSAAVDNGCRINVSVLQGATSDSSSGCYSLAPFAPDSASAAGSPATDSTDPSLAGTEDIYDYLCAPGHPGQPRDLSLSTASLLAARFPYISPTGGLTGCGSPQRRTFGMDGGVLDNSGTSALAEIWSSAAGQIADYNADESNPTCVEPRLLIINNGYADPAPVAVPAQPEELLAPLDGQSQVDDSLTERDEQRAALEFQEAFGASECQTKGGTQPPATVPTRVAVIQPSARPGPYAPLGWSLSTYARGDLVDQLGSAPNQCEFAVVRDWYAEPEKSPFAANSACLRSSMTSPAGPVGGG